MSNFRIAVVLFFVATAAATAQPANLQHKPQFSPEVRYDSVAVRFANSITVDDLKKDLYTLASDAFEGRETGQKGLLLAANYIADHFKANGLQAGVNNGETYFQEVPLANQKWETTSLNVNGNNFKFNNDFFANIRTPELKENLNEVVFLGWGIDAPNYSDYKNRDVKGKIVMVLSGEPTNKKGINLITNSTETSEWSQNWRKKVEVARQKGVKMLFIVSNDVQSMAMMFGNNPSRGTIQLKTDADKSPFAPAVYISPEVANQLVPGWEKLRNKTLKKGKPKLKVYAPKNAKIELIKNFDDIAAKNVLGIIEGSDPSLKNEYIVITAHFDHLGKRDNSIFYGADDDASGTSALLEMAQAFAQAKASGKGPRRSILFMPVSGEEKGLLGSAYYTDSEPVIPLAQTVCNLNIDMVGRVDDFHKNGNYVYLIGSDKLSSDLHKISEAANDAYTQIELDYKYNSEKDPNQFYYRSDHYNFAKNNIPVIFYFNGTHKDYHQPSDTPDKINFEALQKRTQLVFYTAWELANRDKRIVVDSNKK
ncbi:MAG: M28 family peptidase [Sphingobacteriales bacterium]|jgi:Zn-dependent M28 family amino/carboxypeptidase|nr:M28 family peptidase [Sphingobacteriales bacterium]MBP9140804.1 M28 family peptidase [Chitinophagales bacterium]MDA0198344.1 M28 family peptidase [Bacteroidota bacterium]MBK6891214.1 M28 family peptidase [Sphingobacteriales bacterium]MBK7526961.1 M28 family peptidase [Sphingobacteriales bacterium]